MSIYIEKCTRKGCYKIAVCAWVNGAACVEHRPNPDFSTPIHHTPQVLDAYRQGWADALAAITEWGEETEP